MIRQNKGSVRIIGGKWRGRRLHFDATAELRPTKDLVRETLFNWLAPVIVDSICLDLFAGSGALGFEALSRGAKYVLMIDQAKKVILHLKKSAELLHAKNVEFLLAQLPDDHDKIPAHKFNLVFLDPPFHQGLIAPMCAWLKNSDYLAPNALIYIEATRALLIEKIIPATWNITHQKTSGEVQYAIAQT